MNPRACSASSLITAWIRRFYLADRDATQLKPSLETVFLTLTGREYRE